MKPTLVAGVASPYLTADQARQYLGLPSMSAFYKLRLQRKRAGKPLIAHRLGRSLRFTTANLDKLFDREVAPLVTVLRHA